MNQHCSQESYHGSASHARENNVDTSALVSKPNTNPSVCGLSSEIIFSCLDCGEEFFYCEPMACGVCGGIEFEEVI